MVEKKRYGDYGGCYVPEVLVEPIEQLSEHWDHMKRNQEFQKQLSELLCHFAGRPTPMTFCSRLSEHFGGPKIYLKREDLLHTGAHKINNTLGQCLLAKKMGKKRIIAETGAGQHGVATATACARLDLECIVYMGAKDAQRQHINVERIRLLGAEVSVVESGSQTLKDAVNEAMRDWSATYEESHYCLGSALGPYPFPEMVASFHEIIGLESKQQLPKPPSCIIACVGGGSNAIGIFKPYLDDESVRLIGVEAGGKALSEGKHAARFSGGSPGVLHGCYTYLLQDRWGMILPTSSISAGLDYPAIGPQHADLYKKKRVEYVSASDEEAVEACLLLSKIEGIIPALESAHALAHLTKITPFFSKEDTILVNLSGRGDKDLGILLDTVHREDL